MKQKLIELITDIGWEISDCRRELEHPGLERNEIWFTEGEMSALLRVKGYIEKMVEESEERCDEGNY